MRKIDLLNLTLCLILVLLFVFHVAWYFYLAVFLIHLGIISIAASHIQLNFFLKAFNSKQQPVQKTICITFDDGPDPNHTIQILNILKEFNAKAAFFVIGHKIKGNEHILNQIQTDGHLIGNHSYSHSNLFPMKSTGQIVEELNQTSALIHQATGFFPQTFRPPFGVTNPNIDRAIKQLAWNTLGWNIRSLDTKKRPFEVTLQRVIKQCKPGSVVLFHDNIPETLQVLQQFLVFLNNHNYKIILPDEMFEFTWYKPNETP